MSGYIDDRVLEKGGTKSGRIGALVGAASGVAILNVVLGRGYTWLYDMVIVPDMPLSGRVLGTDGSVPRAVPTDAVVAILEKMIPGDVVQAGLLLTIFVVVGAGCARLTASRTGAVAAALAACWNPYVVERLVIGHWAFLLGYCCLPWIHATATQAVRGGRASWVPLGGWLALASLAGSTSAVIATLMALISVALAVGGQAKARLRVSTLVLGAMAVLNAAWIVPSFTRLDDLATDPAGVDVFAARADTPLGVWTSLLTLGGIWHQPSWPGSRSSAVVVLLALLVLVVVLTVCVRNGLARELLALGAAGLVGLAVAGAAAVPGGHAVVEWVVIEFPGGGIIRDSQKFVALFAIFVAVAAGRAVEQIAPPAGRPAGPERTQRWILAVGLAVAPIATMPDAPVAAGKTMGTTSISADVGAARAFLDTARAGSVAVFPWTQYRRFAWNDDRISLDPWNRLLDRDVIVNDDLPLARQTVQGEDPIAAEIGRVLASPNQDLPVVLRRNGVRWVIVLADQPGAQAATDRFVPDGLSTRSFGDVQITDLGEPLRSASVDGSNLPILLSGSAALAAIGVWVILGAAKRLDSRGDPFG